MLVTSRNIATLPDGKHPVAPNLFLKVRGASKSFVFRYTDKWGERRELSLGSLRKVTLTEAKAKANELLQEIAEGVYPNDKPKQKKGDERFSVFAERTYEIIRTRGHWRGIHTESAWERSLDAFILPVLKDLHLSEITRDHILEILNPIWLTKPVMAKRVRANLEKLFSYAVADGQIDRNPASWNGNLEMFLPAYHKVHTSQHYESPTIEELQRLWVLFGISPHQGAKATMLGMLTATRTNEFVPARWEEFDLEERVWTCPRRKDGKPEPFRIPLSDQAVALLRSLPRDSEWVFVSRRASCKNKPINNSSSADIMKSTLGRPVTAHGMRSTFRVWCAESGVDFIVAETCLMHSTGNAVTRAYQRSDLLEQRRVVMQKWADVITKSDT